MVELKTKPTDANVEAFIASVVDERKRNDSLIIMEMLRQVTGKPPKMWGNSIVGYGEYHYKYASGREGDWFVAGFSPRKQSITIYGIGGFDAHPALLARLGKYKLGVGCLYINKLQDVDQDVLRELMAAMVEGAKPNEA
jgi:hypothetical protein